MQGTLPVTNGKFEFTFDPAALNKIAPTYETSEHGQRQTGNRRCGASHLLLGGKTPDGKRYQSFVRLIIRGNTVHYTR